MNEVINSRVEWWQGLILILTLTISVVAIKIAISFDINKFLERRDVNNRIKLKNACPHFMIGMVEGSEIEIRSLYYQLPGTFSHICKQCGLEAPLDMEQHKRDARYYAKNPKALIERQEKFTKLAKKFGKVAKK